jgi:hypothetical protein
MSPSEELAMLMLELGNDEQRVVLAIAQRLALGRRQYGALDLATDQRTWMREAYEEALDMSNYLAMALVSQLGRHCAASNVSAKTSTADVAERET